MIFVFAHRTAKSVGAFPFCIGWHDAETKISRNVYIQPTSFNEFDRATWCASHEWTHAISFEEAERKGLSVIAAVLALYDIRGKELIIDSAHVKYAIAKIQWQVGVEMDFRFTHLKSLLSVAEDDAYESIMKSRRLPGDASRTAEMMSAAYGATSISTCYRDRICAVH